MVEHRNQNIDDSQAAAHASSDLEAALSNQYQEQILNERVQYLEKIKKLEAQLAQQTQQLQSNQDQHNLVQNGRRLPKSLSFSQKAAYNDNKNVKQQRRPDIIFAYANVFGHTDEQNNFIAYEWNKIINPDEMFNKIEQAAQHQNSEGKALRIEKRILNWQTFDLILEESPRLLFIMCHGMFKNKRSQFLFEDEEKPYLSQNYDDERLLSCLQRDGRTSKIDAIVLSTCHSEELGKIFLQGNIQPAPKIIAINALESVLEWSTLHFNPKFIKLLINGKPIDKAFKAATDYLDQANDNNNEICCCKHSHDVNCLFMRKVRDEFAGDMEAAHKKLHQPSCECQKNIRDDHVTAGDGVWEEIKHKLPIIHEYHCKQFKTFYRTLKKGVKPVELIDYQQRNPNFIRQVDSYKDQAGKIQFNYWCCCRSNIAHRESDKFILVNDIFEKTSTNNDVVEVNLNDSQSAGIFDEVELGKLTVKKPNFKNIVGLKDNYPNFFTRKEQVKQLIDFLLKSGSRVQGKADRIVIIHGPQSVDKLEPIAKAVWYAKEHEEVIETVRDGAYLIDLTQANDMNDIYQAITELLEMTGVKAQRKQILQSSALKHARRVLVFEGLNHKQAQLQKEFLAFLVDLIYSTENLKIIHIVNWIENNNENLINKQPKRDLIQARQQTDRKLGAKDNYKLNTRITVNIPAHISITNRNEDFINDEVDSDVSGIKEQREISEKQSSSNFESQESSNINNISIINTREDAKGELLDTKSFKSKAMLDARNLKQQIKGQKERAKVNDVGSLHEQQIYASFEKIEVGQVTQGQAIEYLLYLAHTEKKIEIIEEELPIIGSSNDKNQSSSFELQLSQHAILEIWRQKQFRLNFAREIVRKLSSQFSLANIVQEALTEQSRFKNFMVEQPDDHLHQLKREMLDCFDYLKNNGHILLNNLLSFIVLCPRGICLNEFQLIAEELLILLEITSGTTVTTGTKISVDFLFNILREMSCSNSAQDRIVEPTIVSSNYETPEPEFANRDFIIQQVVFLKFIPVQKLDNEIKVQMKKNYLDIMQQILSREQQVQQTFGILSKRQLYKTAINFFSRYAYQILFKIEENQSNLAYENLTLQTANLLFDSDSMWHIWYPQNNNKIFAAAAAAREGQNKNNNLGYYQQRFKEIKMNMIHILKESTIADFCPELCDSAENFDNKNDSEFWCNFKNLCILLPSILAKTGDYRLALKVIKDAETILKEKISAKEAHATLTLMRISIKLHEKILIYKENYRNNDTISDLNEFQKEFFTDISESKMLFQSFQNVTQSQDQEWLAEIYFLNGLQMVFQDIYQLQEDTNSKAMRGKKDLKFQVETSLQYMQSALDIFQRKSNLDYGQLKCVIQIVKIQLNPSAEQDFVSNGGLTYFEAKKKDIGKNINKIMTLTQKMQTNTEIAGQKVSISNYIRIYCAYFKAQLEFNLDDQRKALQLINEAQNQILRLDFINSGIQMSDLITGLNELQMKVLEKLSAAAASTVVTKQNNLFTFLKASPIVYSKDQNKAFTKPMVVSDMFRQSSKFYEEIVETLQQSDQNIQVQFGIMSKHMFQQTLVNGKTKVLHISSEVIDESKICFEKKFREAKMIDMKKFRKIILNQACKVEVAVIAMPLSRNIGQVLHQDGLKHVLCFDQVIGDKKGKQITSNHEGHLQIDFINKFCLQLYGSLIDGNCSVKQAFSRAQLSSINQIKSRELNILPLLIDKDNEIHNSQLVFDQANSSNNVTILTRFQPQTQFIGTEDKTEEESNYQQLPQQQQQYFGHQQELHQAITYLGRQQADNIDAPLLLIMGDSKVGKTRFTKEICGYFVKRNEFQHTNVLFQDLSKIKSEESFTQFLQKLDQILIKCRQKLIVGGNEEIKPGAHGVLWTLSNLDLLKKRFINRLDSYMYDTMRENDSKDLRILMTFNSDNVKRYIFPLQNFYFDESQKSKNSNYFKIHWMQLQNLDKENAIQIFRANCLRNFNTAQLELIKNSNVFNQVYQLPSLIIELSKMLHNKSDGQIQTIISKLTLEEVIMSVKKQKSGLFDKTKKGQDSLHHTPNPLDNLLYSYETSPGASEDTQQSSELPKIDQDQSKEILQEEQKYEGIPQSATSLLQQKQKQRLMSSQESPQKYGASQRQQPDLSPLPSKPEHLEITKINTQGMPDKFSDKGAKDRAMEMLFASGIVDRSAKLTSAQKFSIKQSPVIIKQQPSKTNQVHKNYRRKIVSTGKKKQGMETGMGMGQFLMARDDVEELEQDYQKKGQQEQLQDHPAQDDEDQASDSGDEDAQSNEEVKINYNTKPIDFSIEQQKKMQQPIILKSEHVNKINTVSPLKNKSGPPIVQAKILQPPMMSSTQQRITNSQAAIQGKRSTSFKRNIRATNVALENQSQAAYNTTSNTSNSIANSSKQYSIPSKTKNQVQGATQAVDLPSISKQPVGQAARQVPKKQMIKRRA